MKLNRNHYLLIGILLLLFGRSSGWWSRTC